MHMFVCMLLGSLASRPSCWTHCHSPCRWPEPWQSLLPERPVCAAGRTLSGDYSFQGRVDSQNLTDIRHHTRFLSSLMEALIQMTDAKHSAQHSFRRTALLCVHSQAAKAWLLQQESLARSLGSWDASSLATSRDFAALFSKVPWFLLGMLDAS